MSTGTDATAASATPRLRRAITPNLLLLLVIGDMLGTGIYSLTGDVAATVGGASWLAFGAAFVVASFTATAYLELVGKYPRAAGAALYVQEAFASRFLTFLVAFAVTCSALASVGAASRSFAGYAQELAALPTLLVALGFIFVLAGINLRGVEQSVKVTVALTCIELVGLLIVIAVGAAALTRGIGDASNAFTFNADADPFVLVATGAGLAFFAIVGFEDSVNLVEETVSDRSFPRAFFGGITVVGVVYMLVAFFTTALVPIEVLRDTDQDLLEVIRVGAQWFPLMIFAAIAMCAVTNTALVNLMMASRLLYGMAQQQIVPRPFGAVHARWRTPWIAIIFTTALALGLASWGGGVRALGGTTALLLLGVFTLVNVAALVLRAKPVTHEHYRAPTLCPLLGAASCAYLASPWSGRAAGQYAIAGVLLLIGVLVFAVNYFVTTRRLGRNRPSDQG